MLVDFELPEPPTVGALTLEPGLYPIWTAPLSDVPAGGTAAHATLAGPCPADVPDEVLWDTRTRADLDPTSTGPRAGDALLVSRAEGDNCALFTTLDWLGSQSLSNGTTTTGRHGPVVMRDFMDEGPVPPAVGTPVWNAVTGKFEIPVSRHAAPARDLRPVRPDHVSAARTAGYAAGRPRWSRTHRVDADPTGLPHVVRDVLHRRQRRARCRLSFGRAGRPDVPQG